MSRSSLPDRLDAPYRLPVADMRIPLREPLAAGMRDDTPSRIVEMRDGQAYLNNKPVIVVPSDDSSFDRVFELERPHTLLVKIEPLPKWIKKHTEIRGEIEEQAVEWMRKRPSNLIWLMQRFPPSCVVRAVVKLEQPKPWEYGIVQSYIEPDEECPHGMVSVHVPDSNRKHRSQCHPEWLKVVDYWNGITPEKVCEILKVKMIP